MCFECGCRIDSGTDFSGCQVSCYFVSHHSCLTNNNSLSYQWWVFGYSLTFSKTGGKFIGNLDNAFFMGVTNAPSIASQRIPESLYALFQCMFAAITPALAIGSAAERGRLLPTLVFVFIWSTLIYDPIACWTWGPN